MCGGPGKCQDTRQSASASLPGCVTATCKGTSTSCPGGTADNATRVRPHQAYCRTGGRAPTAASATGALLLQAMAIDDPGWPMMAATAATGAATGAGAQVATPIGATSPSGSLPTSMHTAAGAAMVLRNSSVSGRMHSGEVPKSWSMLAGPRSCASMGGAVYSLRDKRREKAGQVYQA